VRPTAPNRVSGLKPRHKAEMDGSAEFAVNWAVVKDWSERDRYALGHSQAEARDLYAAVTGRRHGILQWLKKYW
jgi:hypothetical protein